MTRKEFVDMLEHLSNAWSRREYAKAASFFADNVTYADPVRYSANNRAELLGFFRDDGGFEQTTVWHNIVFDETQQIGAAEYSYRGTHLYHGVVMIKLENDKITHWREYQHISDVDWEEFCAGTAFGVGGDL